MSYLSTLLISLSVAAMSDEGIMVSFARLRRRRSYCSHGYYTTEASFAGFLCQRFSAGHYIESTAIPVV
jgi:hypothetical protein